MKTILVHRNLGQGLPDYKEGETVDADDHIAEHLCGVGLASLVEKPRKKSDPAPEASPKEESASADKKTR